MKVPTSRSLLLVAGLLVVVGLPLAGTWARRRPGDRCEFDGLPVEPRYRVRVADRAGGSHTFCCVRCAGLWLQRQGESPAAVRVTDEASGAEIDAAKAFFVRSTVVTDAITGNRVHVFGGRADAEEHARAYAGRALTGGERPFAPETAPAGGR
jgi:hypothetical protein